MFLVEVFGMPCIWPGPDSDALKQLVQCAIPEVFAEQYRGDATLYVTVHQSDTHAMTTLKFPGDTVPGAGNCVLVTVRPMGTKTINASTRVALIDQLANVIGGYVFTRTSRPFGEINMVKVHVDSDSYRVTSTCLRESPRPLEVAVEVVEPRAA